MKKLIIYAYINRIEALDSYIKSLENSGLSQKAYKVIFLNPTDEYPRINASFDFEIKNVMNQSMEEAYNMCLGDLCSEYVHFDQVSSFFDARSLKILENLMEKGVLLISLNPFYQNNNGVKKHYPMAPREEENEKSKVIELAVDTMSQIILQAYFIKSECFEDVKIDTNLHEEGLIKCVVDLLYKYETFSFLPRTHYYYTEPLENNIQNTPIHKEKYWYNDSLDKIKEYLNGIENEVPMYIQDILLYLIVCKLKANYSFRNKGVLNSDEVKKFYSSASDILQYIDGELIVGNSFQRTYSISRVLKVFLLKLKYRTSDVDYKIDDDGELIVFGEKMSFIQEESMEVYTMHCLNDCIEIDAKILFNEIVPKEAYSIICKLDEENIEVSTTDVYSNVELFGECIFNQHFINIKLPLKKLKNNSKIVFYLKYSDFLVPLNLNFPKTMSKLQSHSKRVYWKFYKNYVMENHIQELHILKYSKLDFLWKEILLVLSKLYHSKNKKRAIKYLGIRELFFITRPYYKRKRILVTFDKLYKAGDNGEYFFRYCLEEQDKYQCYYYIDKQAEEYRRLKNESKYVIKWRSIRGCLLALNADAIVATHTTIMNYTGLPKAASNYLKNLYNAKIICIQHGLTVQDIAQFQNKLFDDTMLYCVASKHEEANILQPIYGYNQDQVKLTGLARYDGLNRDYAKKVILIAPTWRRNLVEEGIASKKKNPNEHFKNSEYYRIYNNLINDSDFLETAHKKGYKIKYLLHPAMSPQIDDYEKNDFVELIAGNSGVSYEDLLNEASLMITDYSGVQFDFAYMRKPILYYHPKSLPPHYDENTIFAYDTMGFGPVIENHETLISSVCKYMNNDCRMEDKYKARADDFFEFDDQKNNKRIYIEIDKFIEKEN